MNRITEKTLRELVKTINSLTYSPNEPYSQKDGKLVSNIGNYHLSFAYGGVSLHRISNEHGGTTDVLNSGHTTKRDLFNLIHAYIKGLTSNKETL